MLTREGFVAANMSGQSTLQRSSWKAEAIRKGNLKISGPIPIMEDTPLNDEEEKEYAETGALQSPIQPPNELEPLESRPQTPPQPEHPPPSIPMERASLMSHPVDEQTQEVIQERQASRSPPRQQYVTETARESVVEPISYSQNGHRSTPESASKAAQKKKRKSGLRNVFRKMFGRRSRDEPEQEEVSHRGHSYHHSVSQDLLFSIHPKLTVAGSRHASALITKGSATHSSWNSDIRSSSEGAATTSSTRPTSTFPHECQCATGQSAQGVFDF